MPEFSVEQLAGGNERASDLEFIVRLDLAKDVAALEGTVWSLPPIGDYIVRTALKRVLPSTTRS